MFKILPENVKYLWKKNLSRDINDFLSKLKWIMRIKVAVFYEKNKNISVTLVKANIS